MEQSAVERNDPIVGGNTPTQAPRFTSRAWIVVGHYATFSLAYFGLMAILVVALSGAGMPPSTIAVCSIVLIVSSKVAKIPVAFVLDRYPPHLSLMVGCCLSGLSLVALPYAMGPAAVLILLFLVGLGVSINGLSSKQVAADASDALRSRAILFSLINMAVNVASAIASAGALMILSHAGRRIVFLVLGLIYCLAGVLGGFLLRSTTRAAAPSGQWWGPYRNVVRTRGIWSLLILNGFCWFFYAQLFGALPLFVKTHLETSVLAVLISVNAISVIVLQMPVAWLLRAVVGERPRAWILISLGLFAAAFCVAWKFPTAPGLFAMIVVFSIAEACFVPAIDVDLVGRVNGDLRATGYAVVSLSTAGGEALGSATGISLVARLGTAGPGGMFWLVMAGSASLAAVLASLAVRAGRGDPREEG